MHNTIQLLLKLVCYLNLIELALEYLKLKEPKYRVPI